MQSKKNSANTLSFKKACPFFQTPNKCRNKECPFEHPTKICEVFKANLPCPYGDNCWNLHSQKSTYEICEFFQSKGFCKKGALCKFSHVREKLFDISNVFVVTKVAKQKKNRKVDDGDKENKEN